MDWLLQRCGSYAAVVRAGLALWLTAISAGCQGDNAEAAYVAGDYLQAREYYNAKQCNGLEGDRAAVCHRRAKEIDGALLGASH